MPGKVKRSPLKQYSEEGRKSKTKGKKGAKGGFKTINKYAVKYKASKGADFDDEGSGHSYATKSIKKKVKYTPEQTIKKIKTVKKTKDGGRKVTVSKRGIENNLLAPPGAKGLVTVKNKENKKFKEQVASPLNQTTASVRDEELRSAHLSNAEEKYWADYTPEKLEQKYYDQLDASKPRSPREMRKFRRQGKKATDVMRKAERKANRELNR